MVDAPETCIFSAVIIGKEVQWWNTQLSLTLLVPSQSVCLNMQFSSAQIIN